MPKKKQNKIAVKPKPKAKKIGLSQHPKTGTKAARDFFETNGEIITFVNWVAGMATWVDQMREYAIQALLETEKSEKEKKQIQKREETRLKMIEVLGGKRQFFMEVVLVRHVDNFLNYLSSLLYDVFIQKPDTLKSNSKQVSYKFILDRSTMKELVQDVAQRTVEELSYKSYQDLEEYFKNRLGLILSNKSDNKAIIGAIEIRNISVHNRCIINERYVNRTGIPASKIGKKRSLGLNFIEKTNEVFVNTVVQLDKSARKKFKIKGIRFNKAQTNQSQT